MFEVIREYALRIWEKSWTKTLAWVQGAASTALFALSYLYPYVSDPTIKEYLNVLNVPSYVTVSLGVLSLVTYLAHGHEND